MATAKTRITSGHVLRWVDARLVGASVDPHDVDTSAVAGELNSRLNLAGDHTVPAHATGRHVEQWVQQAIPDEVFWSSVERNPAFDRCVSVAVRDPYGRLLWSSPGPTSRYRAP